MKRTNLPVRYTGTNKHAEYYKVNEKFNVTHNVMESVPFTCLDCPSNDCEHCDAVRDHLAEHGVTA